MSKCFVIGAGIAGIAAAIRLACKGFEVVVFEANPYVGGKLGKIQKNGFRFDTGPSLFTMPHFVDELFTLAGKNPRDYFNYQKLDILCKYFFEDDTHISAFNDQEKFVQEITLKTKESAKNITKYLKQSARKYNLTADLFLYRSLHKFKTYFNFKTLKGILNLLRLDIFSTMHQTNQKHFTDPKLIQLFDRYATYNGSDPYQAPGILTMIPHLEHHFGAFFPEGGMYSITQSLFTLAKELGVEFRINTKVNKIILENNKAIGIQTNNKEEFAEVIISNSDITQTYKYLLPTIKPPKKILDQPKSSSAIIFYWGINKTFPKLDLHNIFFSQNYKEEFTYIFDKKDVGYDPTIYINITSKLNTSDAPENCENWFILINTPNNTGQDWDAIIQKTRKNIIDKINRLLHTQIENHIQYESILDPRTIQQRTSSDLGALYGNSSNNKYAAFLRHANFSSHIKNLYFCGGSVHPGGGIPLCLSSAKIVASLIN